MIAIYTRLSKEDSDSTSIQNQIREGQAFAKDNGFTDILIYNEGQGVSGGAEIKDRPQLFKLLQDFRNNEIKAVWFRNQNRLERNSNTWHIFTSEARKYNIAVYFNDKLFDFNNPQENLFGNITSALNQYQKDLQSAQTKRTLRDNVKEGKVWSVVAYGYESNNGYLNLNEDEATIVKLIYELSLSGKGTNWIANHLNQKEIPTRKNALWRSRTVQSIIKNSLYKGVRVFSGNSYDAPKIIEPIYWQKVNDNLKNNVNNSGKKVEHKYLLKGFIKCMSCGKNYYGRRRVNKKDNFYTCVGKRYKEVKCTNRGINIDVLEYFIWQRFFADKRILQLTKDYLKQENIDDKLNDLQAIRETLSKGLSQLQRERKNAIQLAIKGVIDEADIKPEIERIDSLINDQNIKVNNLEKQIEFLSQSNKVKQGIDDDLENLRNASFNDKRTLIKKYIKSIEVLYLEPYYNIRIEFTLNDYLKNNEEIKTDFYGSKIELINFKPDNSITPLIENYILEKNYNIAVDVCYNYVFTISDKAKKLDEKSIKDMASRFEEDFDSTYKPTIDLVNNRLLFD